MAFLYDFENASRQIKTNKARVAANMIRLREYLDGEVPAKSVFENLLIATWNIKWLGHYGRLDESLWYIAEILSRFDLIAVQEVRADLKDFKRIVDLLGPWWRYVVTDVTEGDAGNEERLAFMYDSRKVRFGGLAGEIVLPPIEGENDEPDRPVPQFDRTPFVTGFHSGWFDFMVATVHLHWGDGERETPRRVEEADALARFLKARLEGGKTWAPHLIEGADLPDTGAGADVRFYDQIGFLFSGPAPIEWPKAGVLNPFDAVYRDDQLETYGEVRGTAGRPDPRKYYTVTLRRNEMSDHFPLWTQLKIDFPDGYLAAAAGV
jgi:endonuclease/exonuclease/phosphatase family metal-dependent hydrolase